MPLIDYKLKEELSKLEGKRIELLFMKDEDDVEPGDKGKVLYVDDLCHIHIEWDNGSTLSIIPGTDRYRVLREKEMTEDILGY